MYPDTVLIYVFLFYKSSLGSWYWSWSETGYLGRQIFGFTQYGCSLSTVIRDADLEYP